MPNYYVLTKDGATLVTTSNPYSLGLTGWSVHEMDGDIPDLNTHVWDDAADAFIRAVRTLTTLEFLNRFTSAERIAIQSSTNQIVGDFMYLLESTELVRLDSATTIAGVNYLAAVGLITSIRAAEILA